MDDKFHVWRTKNNHNNTETLIKQEQCNQGAHTLTGEDAESTARNAQRGLVLQAVESLGDVVVPQEAVSYNHKKVDSNVV